MYSRVSHRFDGVVAAIYEELYITLGKPSYALDTDEQDCIALALWDVPRAQKVAWVHQDRQHRFLHTPIAIVHLRHSSRQEMQKCEELYLGGDWREGSGSCEDKKGPLTPLE